MPLVECVPNFSEGRRPEIVKSSATPLPPSKVAILDVSSDQSHNRTSSRSSYRSSMRSTRPLRGFVRRANTSTSRITPASIRAWRHRLVPFIPLEGTTMEDCIVLARTLGERVGRDLAIPVFLYERAATSPARENLADVRRGEFEGIRDEMKGGAAARKPDFAPHTSIRRGRGRDRRTAVPRRVQCVSRPCGEHACRESVAKAVRGSSADCDT